MPFRDGYLDLGGAAGDLNRRAPAAVRLVGATGILWRPDGGHLEPAAQAGYALVALGGASSGAAWIRVAVVQGWVQPLAVMVDRPVAVEAGLAQFVPIVAVTSNQ